MKKLYYNLVLTLVAAVLAVGCTEDLTGDVNGAVAGSDFEYIEVTAGLESAESRTTLTDSGNGGKMTWSAGDAIGAIMEDGTITECVATAVDGASATFSVPSERLEQDSCQHSYSRWFEAGFRRRPERNVRSLG